MISRFPVMLYEFVSENVAGSGTGSVSEWPVMAMYGQTTLSCGQWFLKHVIMFALHSVRQV